MIPRKISELTALDGHVVIEADGNSYAVEVDVPGITSVTLHGDLPALSWCRVITTAKHGALAMGTEMWGAGAPGRVRPTERTTARKTRTMAVLPMGVLGRPMPVTAMLCGKVKDTGPLGGKAKETGSLTTKDPEPGTLGETEPGTGMLCGKGRAPVSPLARAKVRGVPSGLGLGMDMRYAWVWGTVRRCAEGEGEATLGGKAPATEAPGVTAPVAETRRAKGQATEARGAPARARETRFEVAAGRGMLGVQHWTVALPNAPVMATETRLRMGS